jgi:chromate transporter
MTGGRPHRLRELAVLFLKLGTIGFGGPAAHIALMEDEVVRRRRWLTPQEFLDLVGATNLIPGPNSTELAIHVGRLRAGAAGLAIAGTAFILPAVVIVSAFAWAYREYGTLPEMAAILYGVKPVVMAVVAQALIGLGRTALKSAPLALLGGACLAAIFALDAHELVVLGSAAALAGGVAWWRSRTGAGRAAVFPPLMALAPAAAGAGVAPIGLWPLFLVFMKAGGLLFGSGYVLLAFLRADLVERLGWLTDAQLLDAVAVGQVTPGPVFTTATFIGFVLAGWPGACVATLGIFLPAFVFVALSAPFVERMRRSAVASAVLDAVNIASLALMAAVTGLLVQDAIGDLTTASLAVGGAVLLVRYRLNSAWLIAGGAAIGLMVKLGI